MRPNFLTSSNLFRFYAFVLRTFFVLATVPGTKRRGFMYIHPDQTSIPLQVQRYCKQQGALALLLGSLPIAKNDIHSPSIIAEE